jgi:chromate transporter
MTMTRTAIFGLFFRAGLAFGGGLGILAVLEEQLVRRRAVITRDEFLATYSLGRIVPSGTMTALAVALGYRLGGWSGTVMALAGLALPAFTSTVALTIGYTAVRDTSLFALVPSTILPAALALVAGAAVNLSAALGRRVPDLALAGTMLIVSALLRINPPVLLIVGGLAGAVLLRPPAAANS